MTVFLFMSGISLPPIGALLLPFVTQPVLLFGFKYGIGYGLGVALVATLLLALFAGEELSLLYGLFAILSGVLLGLVGRIRRVEYLLVGAASAMFVWAVGVAYYFFGSWAALAGDFRAGLTQQFATATRMQEQLGFSKDSLETVIEKMPQLIDMTLQLLPGLLFLTFGFIALINVLSLRRRFPERRAEWFAIENFRDWKGPEPLVWGLIACGFGLFFPLPDLARLIAMNLLLIVGAFYFAQGLAVIAFFFHKNNVPRFLRGITYVLIVFQQIFTLMVVGLGLFDLWGDFRRLGKDNLTPSQAS
ncbi:MAG TPA: DUF2232 domain-containing protein [Candidatus Binatia bacterium]